MALVAAYAFDEGSGTVAADATGNGNDLTVGTVDTAWVTGHTNHAIAGTSASSSGAVSTALSNSAAACTMMGWVNPSSLPAAGSLALFGFWSNSDPNDSSQFCLWAERGDHGTPNVLQGNVRVGSLQDINGPALTPGTWTHLALTYDGTNIRLFVGGTLYSTVSAPGMLGVGTLAVATDAIAAVDDVRVLDTALTATDITTYMNTPVTVAGTPRTAAGTVTLVGVALARGRGAAAGTVTLTGASSGRGAATAPGTLALTGAATARATAAGSGVITLSGTAVGHAVASTSGTMSLSGNAGANAPATAAGAMVLGGTATYGNQSTAAGGLTLTGHTTGRAEAAPSGAFTLAGMSAGRAAATSASVIVLTGTAVSTTGLRDITVTGALETREKTGALGYRRWGGALT